MSFITNLAAKRQKFLDGLDANEGDINLRIFEDFYPDEAHFLYELLQNAEDTGATEVYFELDQDGCTFVHNGLRYFDDGDIAAITGIFNSSKKDNPDKIGKFGVGFKSVYVYTETPHIWSPTVAFKITDLFLPTEIPARKKLGRNTRFEFPFNSPKKLPAVAYSEIKSGLTVLPESALLFLGNIKSIKWRIGEDEGGKISRVQHSDCHIELTREAGDKISSTHFLQFRKPVENLPKQYVAIAFNLAFLPKISTFRAEEALSSQFRIAPAAPGRVSVFFPAEKETSGLRFHLHAPFVPELSRASIKDTPANIPLYAQLAALTAAALHGIRDLGLLTGDFLAVLPNPQDVLPIRYQIIRQAIINEMNDQALTPTQSKSHAPAKVLLQGKVSMKELLTKTDVGILRSCLSYREYDYNDRQNLRGREDWAISPNQRNGHQDKFLSGLAIKWWDVESFVNITKEAMWEWWANSSSTFRCWLQEKPLDWHQQFYAFLFCEAAYAHEDMANYFVIRCDDGQYQRRDEICFPQHGKDSTTYGFQVVAKEVYSSGNSKLQQEDSFKFLKAIGVRELGEADEVLAILNYRYAGEKFSPDIGDMKRFIALVENEPDKISIFSGYSIFFRTDGQWARPSGVFIDKPFIDTKLRAGLPACYEFARKRDWDFFYDGDVKEISIDYLKSGINSRSLVHFAERCGCLLGLKFKKITCLYNPSYAELVSRAGGGWSDRYGINEDYELESDTRMPSFPNVLDAENLDISTLMWKTLCDANGIEWFNAKYRNNSQHRLQVFPSTLAYQLRNYEWIPQGGGLFVCPAEASGSLLPDGFQFDPSWPWLKAIRFGADTSKKSEELERTRAAQKSIAIELGFPDEIALQDARRFANLTPEERQSFFDGFERKQKALLPENEPSNPEIRSKRVGLQALDAPGRESDLRTRSVSMGLADVKKRASKYLQHQYTNADGEMICQVCQDTLPFKLIDDTYYFEKVEFLPDINNRHYQNYLALCPNHAAMYQHANGSAYITCDAILELIGNELGIILAGTEHSLYFTKTHIADMKQVIEADMNVGQRDERGSEIIEDEEA